jgi:hypothetical protein
MYMTKLRAIQAIGLGFCGAVPVVRMAVIRGAVMVYRQPKAGTRAAIIPYLKEMN